MGRKSTPAKRSSEAKRSVARVRRKYKVNVSKPRKLVAGEEHSLGFMCVVLKLASYTNTQIAQVVGVSRGQVKTFLEQPEAQDLLVNLRQKIPAAALELLHGYMIEAVQAMVDVMRKSPDDKLVLAAAAEILDRGGIPKSSRQEKKVEETQNLSITDGGLVEALREAPPEIQEQAANMVEQLENLLAEHAAAEIEAEGAGDDET